MSTQATLAYLETETVTTDPVGLVLVLYDLLLKDLYEAITALRSGEIERRATAIRHSLLVLQELQSTLDHEKGGVVAANLERFYNFTRAKLLEGQMKSSIEIFEQQVAFISAIREAWQQVRQEEAKKIETRAQLEVADSNNPLALVMGAENCAMEHWSA